MYCEKIKSEVVTSFIVEFIAQKQKHMHKQHEMDA